MFRVIPEISLQRWNIGCVACEADLVPVVYGTSFLSAWTERLLPVHVNVGIIFPISLANHREEMPCLGVFPTFSPLD
jgi:hypothetical protein